MFFKEDGIIQHLNNAKILVQLFTCGAMFEEWMDPNHVQKLSDEDIVKGISGPIKKPYIYNYLLQLFSTMFYPKCQVGVLVQEVFL